MSKLIITIAHPYLDKVVERTKKWVNSRRWPTKD